MGEIADSMINGESCSQCGVYFVPKNFNPKTERILRTYVHGHPVLCDDYWEEGSDVPKYDSINAKEL